MRTVVCVQAERSGAVDRMLERMPAGVRAELRESSDRLLAIRSPKQALRAVEHEYEHALRLIVPVVIAHPTLHRRATAAAFAAGFATLAASAEQADELLSVVTVGTLTAPGTSVVVAIGLLATAAETYAAASVRVHQLRDHQRPVDADRLAGDVRRAVLGEVDTSAAGLGLVKQMVDGAAGRLTKRWTVGAVPIFGVGYAAYDATRSVRRVLRAPLPDAVIGLAETDQP
jgi:hypothetical protein